MRKSFRAGGGGGNDVSDSANNASDALQELAETIASLRSQLEAVLQGGGNNTSQVSSIQNQLNAITTAGMQTTLNSAATNATTSLPMAPGVAAPASAISNDPFASIPSAGQPRDALGRFVSGGGSTNNSGAAFFGPDGSAGGYAYLTRSAILPNIQRFAGVVGQGFEMAANAELHGGSQVLEQGRFNAAIASTVIGGVATMFGGPVVGGFAAGVSNSILGPLSDYVNAPIANRLGSQALLTPFAGALYGGDGVAWTKSEAGRVVAGPGGMGTQLAGGRLAHIDAWAKTTYEGTELLGTEKDTAAAYGAIASSMFAGGLDPNASSGVGYGSTTVSPYERFRRGFNSRGGRGSTFDGPIGGIGNGIIDRNRVTASEGIETMSEAVLRRLEVLVGREAAPAAFKPIEPIYRSLPETGGNIADIVSRFGAENTLTYLRLQNDQLSSPIDPMQLARTSANIRGDERQAQFAALQARGSGTATADALQNKLSDISSLPGGRDSLTYAQTNAQLRDARAKEFEQTGITAFELPMSHLSGALERASLMPFAPANVLAMTMQAVGMERQEVARIDAYTRQRRSRGELSESEELQLSNRRESLLTTEAQQITQLSDGFIQRLPSFMSGVPTRMQGRFTTDSMAAFNLSIMGAHHIRAFGASNGQEIQAQDAMFDSIGAPKPPRATSPTQNTANAMNSDKILAVLQQIAQLLASGQRGGGRAGEQIGPVAASLSRTSLGNATQGYGN